jgi:hypothetical protein
VSLVAGETIWEQSTLAANAGPAIAPGIAADLRLIRCIVDRPGIGGRASVGLDLASGEEARLPRLERNLFGHCRDGVVRGDPELVDELLAVAEASDGMVVGDPRFVDPDVGDFRLRPDSPARTAAADGEPEELGAYGGERLRAAGRPRDLELELDPDVGAEPATLLGPSVPNPSRATTTIHFALPEASIVDLGIYNVLGQRVRTLHAGDLPAGDYTRVWDGRDDHGADLPPGIYFVRITQGLTTESRRIVLVR